MLCCSSLHICCLDQETSWRHHTCIMANTPRGVERGREGERYRLYLYTCTCTSKGTTPNNFLLLPTLSLSLPLSLFSLLADAVQIKLPESDGPPYQAEHSNVALYSKENKTSNEQCTCTIHCNLSISFLPLPPSFSYQFELFCLNIHQFLYDTSA